MKLVYLAHKIRDKSHWKHQQNIRAAEAVALELWLLGFAVICPGKNTEHFDGAAPDDTWLKGDFEIIRRCDAIVMGPGWETSKGARAERAFALINGIPIFFWPGERSDLLNFRDTKTAWS